MVAISNNEYIKKNHMSGLIWYVEGEALLSV